MELMYISNANGISILNKKPIIPSTKYILVKNGVSCETDNSQHATSSIPKAPYSISIVCFFIILSTTPIIVTISAATNSINAIVNDAPYLFII